MRSVASPRTTPARRRAAMSGTFWSEHGRVRDRALAAVLAALAVMAAGCSPGPLDNHAGTAAGKMWALTLRAVPLGRLVPLPEACLGWTEGYYPQIVAAGYGAANERLEAAFEQVNEQVRRLGEGPTCVVAAGARSDDGRYVQSWAIFVSASASLLSVLEGVTVVPASAPGEAENYFVACTLALPTGRALSLSELFAEPKAAQSYLTAKASNPVPSSCGLVPGDRTGFALTSAGLDLGYRAVEVSDDPPYDLAVTVPYRYLASYLSNRGHHVVDSVRSPRWVRGQDLDLDQYGNPAS